MLQYFKTVDNCIEPVYTIENDVWVNMVAPTPQELSSVVTDLGIDLSYITHLLDEEEISHIDTEENQTLIVIDVPIKEKNEQGTIIHSTYPLGIVVLPKNIVTVCLKQNDVVQDIINNKVRGIKINHKTRFVFQIFYQMAVNFLQNLKMIDRRSKEVEKQLHKSMKNKELIQLLDLEKSLVYFSTSLNANHVTLQKLSRGRILPLYEEDADLLEDVIVELKQAVEMSNIYSNILSGTMDAFASIISNNLNIVMKFLTAITIVMAIPNMVTGFFGMNVDLPMDEWGVVLPLVSMGLLMAVVAYWMRKKDMF